MAEILLKIDDNPVSGFDDGDVIVAFSDDVIDYVHAANICNPRRLLRDSEGTCDANSLAHEFLSLTRQFRLDRTGPNRVARTNLKTGETVILRRSAGYWRDWIRKQKQGTGVAFFGVTGRERWYGGKEDVSPAVIRRVWSQIERVSQARRRQGVYAKWRYGTKELKSDLSVASVSVSAKRFKDLTEPLYKVDDNGDFVWRLKGEDGFTEARSTQSMATPPDENPRWRIAIEKPRRHSIEWRDTLQGIGKSESEVRNKDVEIGVIFDHEGEELHQQLDQPAQADDAVQRRRG